MAIAEIESELSLGELSPLARVTAAEIKFVHETVKGLVGWNAAPAHPMGRVGVSGWAN